MYDIQGQAAGVPSCQLFGGRLRGAVRNYANINRSSDPRNAAGFARMAESAVAHLLTQHETKMRRIVPRRATLHDVGTGLTHKGIICRKRYLEGKESHVIAQETYHSLEAVDRYLGQFDRVRCCRKLGMSPQETAYTLDCSLGLVQQYLAIDNQLEPEP